MVSSTYRMAGITACALLSGCGAPQAPYVTVFESYFPSWLVCAVIGIFGALILRVVLIRVGIDEHLPARVWVYMIFAMGLMFLTSLIIFAR